MKNFRHFPPLVKIRLEKLKIIDKELGTSLYSCRKDRK